MTLQELKQEQKASIDAAEVIVTTCEAARRGMTDSENEQYKKHMASARSFGFAAKAREEQSTIRSMIGANGIPIWVHDPNALASSQAPTPFGASETRNPEYAAALHAFLQTGGKAHNEALTAGYCCAMSAYRRSLQGASCYSSKEV